MKIALYMQVKDKPIEVSVNPMKSWLDEQNHHIYISHCMVIKYDLMLDDLDGFNCIWL